MTDKFKEVTTNRESIYKGHIIDVYLDDVTLPNGKQAKRELVFHSGAVGIIAITDDQKMIFVRQYRKSLEKSILEIPAGKIDEGETDPLETAKRELEEETFLTSQEMTYLTKFVSSPGFCNEELFLYVATGLKEVANPLARDEDEFLDIVQLTLDEAKEKIKTGEICDAKTMYAILYWESQTK